MPEPRDYALKTENAKLSGHEAEEAFSGYGVMGLPFASGHVLGLRRFPASSVGPGYYSVWHRDPDGDWTFYSDVDPLNSCIRYFGAAVIGFRHAEIKVGWPGPRRLTVDMPSEDFHWEVTVTATPVTRTLNTIGGVIPDSLWHSRRFLGVMSRMVGPMLRAGRVNLAGHVPNQQAYIANPRLIWLVQSSTARLADTDFGEPGPLKQQAFLGDFAIPQRGVLAVGQAYFEPFDAGKHLAVASKSG
ncbi:MAG: hypothetical protein ACHQ01_11030 [Candidatus Limnocylindrales bacterium]